MKRKILIIDDNQSLLDSLMELLERQGYLPEPANDLSVASNLYRRNRPDLILLDYDVRGRDGLELLDDLRAEPPPTSPFIVMTARDDRTIRVRCLQLGAAALLAKPFRMEELVAEVQRILMIRYLLVGDGGLAPLRLLAHHFPKLLGPHHLPPKPTRPRDSEDDE